MKEAPTPKSTTYSYNLAYNDKTYKLDLIQNEIYLNITCAEINSLDQDIFSAEYSKNSLDNLSKFFLLFDNISESLPQILSKIKNNEISINI